MYKAQPAPSIAILSQLLLWGPASVLRYSNRNFSARAHLELRSSLPIGMVLDLAVRLKCWSDKLETVLQTYIHSIHVYVQLKKLPALFLSTSLTYFSPFLPKVFVGDEASFPYSAYVKL